MQTKIYKYTAHDENLKNFADILKSGGTVVFPTETVYGIGCDLFNIDAILKVFAAKGRSFSNPLSAHIGKIDDAALFAEHLSDDYFKLAEKFLPGPLSIIVPANSKVPSQAIGGGKTIGIRVPDEPAFTDLYNAYGSPLAATSANSAGKPSPVTAEHAYEDLNGKTDAILDIGRCRFGWESTVISIADENPKILRLGVIKIEEIENCLGKKVISAQAPGSYSRNKPNTAINVLGSKEFVINYLDNNCDNGKIVCFNAGNFDLISDVDVDWKQLTIENYHESMREADKQNAFSILIFDGGLDPGSALAGKIKSATGLDN